MALGILNQDFPLTSPDLPLLAALKNVPFGVVIIDRQDRYVYVNTVAAELNGYPEEEHFGRRVQDVIPDAWPRVEQGYRHVFATGESVPVVVFQAETAAHPGDQRWWSASRFPIIAGNEVTAVVAFFNDVTETKRAEEARQESETRFLSFMNNLPGAAWMKDRAGRYVFANDEAARMFKIAVADFLGKTDAELFSQAMASLFRENDERAIGGGTLRSVATRKHDDGDHHSIIAKFPVVGVDGHQYLGGIAVDITDRVKAQEALEEKSRHLEKALAELDAAIRIKDDFLGMISHELRTPITSILGNASILVRVRNSLSENQQLESLADLLAEAVRLNQIVENLLVLARLEHGTEVDGEPVRISKAIEHVLEEAKRRNPEREFRFQRLSKEPIAFGVEAYVEQVLRNYVSNAVKYSEPGSRIDVTLRHSDDICVRVLDRGAGLASEDFEHLFQPFYRSTRTSLTTSGVGIGLSVCKRLVEAQRGKVWAKPRSQGGTEFGFALPLAEGGTEAD